MISVEKGQVKLIVNNLGIRAFKGLIYAAWNNDDIRSYKPKLKEQ